MGATLGAVARIDGFTNHIIGKRNLDLAEIVKFMSDTPRYIVIPALDWRSLAAISLEGGYAVVQVRWTLLNRIERLSVDRNSRATVIGFFGARCFDLRAEAGHIQ